MMTTSRFPYGLIILAVLLGVAFAVHAEPQPSTTYLPTVMTGYAPLPDTTRLVTPSGFEGYAGATVTAYQSGDGSVFWACNAKYPDGSFQEAVFHQVGDHSELVSLPKPVAGRGSLVVINGELFLAAWDGPNVAYLERVPGWVR